MESEESDPQPHLIDTTAELLGRAKPRPRRARAPRAAAAAMKKAVAASKRPAARRSTRSKKPAASEANDNTED
jgi:hypothetical protein